MPDMRLSMLNLYMPQRSLQYLKRQSALEMLPMHKGPRKAEACVIGIDARSSIVRKHSPQELGCSQTRLCVKLASLLAQRNNECSFQRVMLARPW